MVITDTGYQERYEEEIPEEQIGETEATIDDIEGTSSEIIAPKSQHFADEKGKIFKGEMKESDENNAKPFYTVFGMARKKGMAVFWWNGKQYTTRKDTDTNYRSE